MPKSMRRFRQFCQRGSNFDNFFLFDEGRKDPNFTLSEQSNVQSNFDSLIVTDDEGFVHICNRFVS